ncbi:B3 domain-containing transcription factor VRN1-like isoform X1 [Euphorbia lathyris]|uniref:B3 domain-containing transcription factor VRN1-like isoform X1 n=1 Tax=Euphorbia lathyris TaxID=212925 RepID=UPI00331413B3
MASDRRRNNQPLSEPERPRFFKLILDDQGKLVFPRKFVRNHGHHLSSHVMLKVPSGAKWEVDVIKSDGQIWLQKGWPEFVKYYSISYAHFLVFEYEKENGDFNVTIFDKTATEIEYPSSFSHEKNMVDEAKEPDVSVQISDPPSRKTLTRHIPKGNRKKLIEKESSSKEQNLVLSNPPQAAKNFNSPNPSFKAPIISDCLNRGRLYITRTFFKNIEPGTKATMLEVNNRFWPVKLLNYPHLGRAALSAGWKAFAKDNSLNVGDVCSFEMINTSDQTLLMKVSIARDSPICLLTNGDDEKLECPVSKVEETRIEIPDKLSSKRKEKSPLSSSRPRKDMKNVENFTDMIGEDTIVEVKKEKGIHTEIPTLIGRGSACSLVVFEMKEKQ